MQDLERKIHILLKKAVVKPVHMEAAAIPAYHGRRSLVLRMFSPSILELLKLENRAGQNKINMAMGQNLVAL